MPQSLPITTTMKESPDQSQRRRSSSMPLLPTEPTLLRTTTVSPAPESGMPQSLPITTTMKESPDQSQRRRSVSTLSQTMDTETTKSQSTSSQNTRCQNTRLQSMWHQSTKSPNMSHQSTRPPSTRLQSMLLQSTLQSTLQPTMHQNTSQSGPLQATSTSSQRSRPTSQSTRLPHTQMTGETALRNTDPRKSQFMKNHAATSTSTTILDTTICRSLVRLSNMLLPRRPPTKSHSTLRSSTVEEV